MRKIIAALFVFGLGAAPYVRSQESDLRVTPSASKTLTFDVATFVATAANLDAQDSRFTECSQAGVFLLTSGTGTAAGWVSNCTASLCGGGFFVLSNATASADLTLTNGRAFGNTDGLHAETGGTGSAAMRIANCVVTRNSTGIFTKSSGGGTASVIGTNPGTNLISGNTVNGATSSIDFLQ